LDDPKRPAPVALVLLAVEKRLEVFRKNRQEVLVAVVNAVAT